MKVSIDAPPRVGSPGGLVEWKRSAFRGIRLFGWQVKDGTLVPNYVAEARLPVRSRSSSFYLCHPAANANEASAFIGFAASTILPL